MKKYIFLAFLSIVLFIVPSCKKEPDHTHNYIKSTVMPSCDMDGYDLFKCDCGDEFQENYVRGYGHNLSDYIYDYDIKVKYKECSICKQKIYEEEFNFEEYNLIYDFNYVLINNIPMCYVYQKNSDILVESYEGLIISEEVYKPATCKETGINVITVKFNIFNKFESVQILEYATPIENHKMSDWVIESEADCINSGTRYKVCEYLCGYKEFETISSLGGHNFEVTQYRENDILHFQAICNNNNTHLVKEDYILNVKDIKPSCENKGSITYKLETWDLYYGEIVYEEVVEYGEAIGHNMIEEIVSKPTEINEGMYKVYCTNCDKVNYYTIPCLLSTSFEKTILNELTCTSKGVIKYEIMINDYYICFTVETNPTGHKMFNGKCQTCGFEDYFTFTYDETGDCYISGINYGIYLTDLIIPQYNKYGEEIVGISPGAFDFEYYKEVVIPSNIKKICNSAFYSTSIEKLIIEEGLIEIGNSAFNLSDIEYIRLPDSLKIIGENAFSNCNKLYQICLGTGLENVHKYAFKDSLKVMEVVNLSSIKNINEYINSYEYKDKIDDSKVIKNEDFIFYYSNNKYILIDYRGSVYGVNLPPHINNCKYDIYENVFRELQIDYLLIPGNVENIMEFAFAYNENLEEVIIEDGVKSLGSFLFYNCKFIKKISIPNSVSFIEDDALTGVDALEELSVPFIGNTYNDEGGKLSSIKADYALINKLIITGNTFIPTEGCYDEAIVELILKDVTEIKDKAFCSNIYMEKITLNEGIKSIGDYAFAYSNITDLVIPDSVEKLGFYSFSCYNLKRIVTPFLGKFIDDNITKVCDIFNLGYDGIIDITVTKQNKIYSHSFENFYWDFNIKLLNVEEILDSAFYSSQIIRLEEAPKLKKIGSLAFEWCYYLEYVDLSNVEALGDRVFWNLTINTLDLSSVKEVGECTFVDCKINTIILKNINTINVLTNTNFDKLYYNNTLDNWKNVELLNESSDPTYYCQEFYYLNLNNEYELYKN